MWTFVGSLPPDAQEVPDHVERQISGEIQYRVIEKVGDKLFHRKASRGVKG